MVFTTSLTGLRKAGSGWARSVRPSTMTLDLRSTVWGRKISESKGAPRKPLQQHSDADSDADSDAESKNRDSASSYQHDEQSEMDYCYAEAVSRDLAHRLSKKGASKSLRPHGTGEFVTKKAHRRHAMEKDRAKRAKNDLNLVPATPKNMLMEGVHKTKMTAFEPRAAPDNHQSTPSTFPASTSFDQHASTSTAASSPFDSSSSPFASAPSSLSSPPTSINPGYQASFGSSNGSGFPTANSQPAPSSSIESSNGFGFAAANSQPAPLFGIPGFSTTNSQSAPRFGIPGFSSVNSQPAPLFGIPGFSNTNAQPAPQFGIPAFGAANSQSARIVPPFTQPHPISTSSGDGHHGTYDDMDIDVGEPRDDELDID